VPEGTGFPIKFNVGKVLFSSRVNDKYHAKRNKINEEDMHNPDFHNAASRGEGDSRLSRNHYKNHSDFIPHLQGAISPARSKSPKYSKQELNDSLKKMNDERLFAAYSTLSALTEKFATLNN
jgi:hypothetical protein